MPYAGPICLSPCRTRYASFVASWLRLCLLHFHAGFRAGTDIGSVAHPDRSSTERSMRGAMSLLSKTHSNWRYTPPQPRELVWQVLCRGACSKLTHQRFELNFRGVIPYIGEQPCAKVKERAVSKPISPCAGRQCYSDAGSRFRIAYLFQNSNVR